MRTISLFAILIVILLLSTSCSINRPISATSNPLGSKVGVFTQFGLLGFPPVATPQAAIITAARNGNISKISTIDYNASYYIFFTRYDTIVTGE